LNGERTWGVIRAVRLLSSLRSLLLALVLVGVVPSFAILAWATAHQRRLLVARAEADAQDLARLVAERHQRSVDRARGLLVGVSALPRLRQLDGLHCSTEIAGILRAAPIYANVGATRRDGTLFCSAAPAAQPVDLSDRLHVRGPLDRGEFTVGRFMMSRTRGVPSLAFGQPVRDDDGRVIAAAVVSFDLRELQRELDELPLPEGAEVVVVDGGGTIVTGRPAPRRLDGAPLDPRLLRPLEARAAVSEIDGLDGVRRLYGFEEVRVGGVTALRVAAGIPAATAFAPVNRIVRDSVLASLAVALLAIAAALLVGERLLVRRLRAVVAASRRIAAGDGAARTGLSPGRDEIGELVGAFDHMAGSLDRLARQNRLLLDAVGDGVVGIDAGGRVIFANPAARRALGWTAEEMLGEDAHALFHGRRPDGSAAPDDECRIRAVMRDGEARAADEVLTRRDGTLFPVEYVSTPLMDGGAVVGVVLVFKDVSERRRLEERLRQAEKMEAVGQLAGGVAHDFNNLLTAIVACARLVRDALPPSHDVQPDLREIEHAAERGATLTRQLLAFGRRQRLAPRPVELRAVVGGIESMLRRLLPSNFALEVHAAAAGTVLADPAQLELVVTNLVVNARDAMPSGGRIVVGVAELEEGGGGEEGLPPGPLAVLSVKDEGSGVDPALRDRIFEPFFTTKPAGRGTGLGLATVDGIVSQSGGAVRLRSEAGRGAEFRVYLPLLAEAAVQPPAADASARAAPPPAAGTVLVVEDDEAIRAIARRTLSRAGYRVLDAGSSESAVRLAGDTADPIDLLLSDVVLPGGNGWELSRELVARLPGLRVLFMSGYPAEHAGGPLLPHGVALLPKPFTPEELLARVRGALDGEAARHGAGGGAPAAAPAARAPNRSA
jgi:two-component system cell cycle sensor histidine kinase/response regulator CckA